MRARTFGLRSGDTVYLDGQLGYRADGELVPGTQPLEQARQCFANVGSGLASLGAEPGDVVRLTCYLTDLAHLDSYRRARAEFLGTLRPALTTVVVAGLAHPDALLEVEATAALGRSAEAGRD